MTRQGVIAEILSRQAREASDDANKEWFGLRRSFSHRIERDHHDLHKEGEEQDKPERSHFRQHDEIMIISGLPRWYLYSFIPQFLFSLLHRLRAVVQAHAEDWVLPITLQRSLEQVEAHIEGPRPRIEVRA